MSELELGYRVIKPYFCATGSVYVLKAKCRDERGEVWSQGNSSQGLFSSNRRFLDVERQVDHGQGNEEPAGHI